jgi:dihydroorotase
MSTTNRREFLGQLGGFALATTVLRQSSPYDLLIAGGHLIDPLQKRSANFDVAIAAGRIARVAASIPRNQARQVIDVSGKIVTPGLIDVHGHVYDGIDLGIYPDLVGIPKGVTTIVDAGTTGSFTFPGFRKYVMEKSDTRIYALLNIATIGLINNELYLDPRLVDPNAAIRTIEANRDRILGIKVRINGRHEEVAHDVEVLKKARQAADVTRVPIMMHWSHEPELLDLLKAGDILVHPFNPQPGVGGMLDENGKVLPQILALRHRGILTDFGHGNHLQWEVAEKAASQGWFPDTISTDITKGHAAPTDPVVDMPNVMSKFLYLGLTVDQVIERVTANASKMFSYPEKLGTLSEGLVADVAVLEIQSGDFEFLDSRRGKRVGHQRFVHVSTIRAGKLT